MKRFTAAVLGLLLLLLAPSGAQAISEEDYEKTFSSTVLPYLAAHAVTGEFQGKDGVSLKYLALERPDEVGALVLVNGYGDSFMKYRESLYDFSLMGFSIYTLDNRGQGQNRRLGNAPGVAHVEDFGDYVEDLKIFVTQVVSLRPHARKFLLGHSMGGAIVALYAQQFPADFDGLILSVPMLEMNTGSTPAGIGATIASFNCTLGKGKDYFPGQGKEKPEISFEANKMTHSRPRWDIRKTLTPDQVGPKILGPSNRWLSTALKTTPQIVAAAGSTKMPVLLFQAEHDTMVLDGGQDRFCQAAPQCRKVVLAGAGHSILAEADPIRNRVMDEIRTFLGSPPG